MPTLSCSEQEQQAGRSARHCCCLQRPFPRLLDPYRAGSSTRDPRVVILLQSGGPSEYAFGVQETRARVRRMAAEVLTSTEWSASLALQQISHRVRFTVHSHDRATLFGTLASRSSHCLRKSCPGRALSAVSVLGPLVLVGPGHCVSYRLSVGPVLLCPGRAYWWRPLPFPPDLWNDGDRLVVNQLGSRT